MFEKLEAVEKRYDELTTQISDPAIIANNNEWRKLIKEHSSMEDVVVKYKEYKQIENNDRNYLKYAQLCVIIIYLITAVLCRRSAGYAIRKYIRHAVEQAQGICILADRRYKICRSP